MNINRNDQDIVRRILQVPFNANTWKLSRHGQDMVRYILIVLFLMLICGNLSRHKIWSDAYYKCLLIRGSLSRHDQDMVRRLHK